MTTYDVFGRGGEYGWLSIGSADTSDSAAKVAGCEVQLLGQTVHSYQDKERLGSTLDTEGYHERLVIHGTGCMADAVSTGDGWVKDVRIFGWFPRALTRETGEIHE